MPTKVFSTCATVIAVFIATTYGFPQKLKGEVICEEGVEYMPHPNCSLYYACSNYVPIVRNCPGILYWNPSLNVCDHSVNVPECQGGTRPPSPEPSSTTQVPTQGSTTPEPEPSHPASKNPTEGSTQEPSYPPTEGSTLEPEPEPSHPHSEAPIPTERSTTSEPPIETTTQNKYPCPPGVPTVYMPHPEDCKAFYICRNGSFGGIFYCGTGLWFSSARQGCVEPKDSDCTVEGSQDQFD
jgi:hypothetical protein